MQGKSFIEHWIFLIGFAAIRKAQAESTRYRGHVLKGQSPRQYARSQGFLNHSHMQRELARRKQALTQQ